MRGAFTPRTRDLMLKRSKGLCERCGAPAPIHQFHHRRPRAMGGTRRTDTAEAVNGLVLHPRCHTWVERNRQEAVELGLLVPQHRDPGDTPVRLWDGWFMLNPDGSKTNVVADVEEPVNLNGVEGGAGAGVAGPLPDQPDDSPLADAKVSGDDI